MEKNRSLICFALAGLLAGCATKRQPNPPTLKDAFEKNFLIGAAINQSQFPDEDLRGKI